MDCALDAQTQNPRTFTMQLVLGLGLGRVGRDEGEPGPGEGELVPGEGELMPGDDDAAGAGLAA